MQSHSSRGRKRILVTFCDCRKEELVAIMIISVVIPACAAQATIARAVRSLIDQTWRDWEAIIVSDDGADYDAHLRAHGLADPRLRFVSTGRVRSGCHNARNVGLAVTRGDLIAALDADDLFHPERLERLAPIAAREGAAVDNAAVVSDVSGETLSHAFAPAAGAPRQLGLAEFLELNVPLFPLVRREHAQPRLAGIEYAEDVVANVRLIDRIGALPALPDALLQYRVVPGSACHADNSAEVFDHAYGEILTRLESDGLGLSPASRPLAIAGFARKRALNRAFAEARRADPSLDFQTFCARRREAAPAYS